MEMDENHAREDLRSALNADTYAQWPELSVFLFSTLPLEVQQALKSNGNYHSTSSGIQAHIYQI
jgi:hypothetical protein